MVPSTVVSLWEVLHLDGKRLLGALHEIVSLYQLTLRHDARLSMYLDAPGVDGLVGATEFLEETAKRLEALTAQEHCSWLRDSLVTAKGSAAFSQEAGQVVVPFSPHDVAGLKRTTDLISTLMSDAIRSRFLFVMDTSSERFWSSEWALSAKAEASFGDAAFEVEEASKCISFERWTASVFHSMRALEVPIRQMCGTFGIAPKNPNWETVLNDLQGTINNLGPAHGASWKADKQRYSAAVAHLRTCQRAWRNYVMHGHATYDSTQARAIFSSVKAFLEDLAA